MDWKQDYSPDGVTHYRDDLTTVVHEDDERDDFRIETSGEPQGTRTTLEAAKSMAERLG